MKSLLCLQTDTTADIILSYLQCLEATTVITEDKKYCSEQENSFNICAEIFTTYLCKNVTKYEEPFNSKVSKNNCFNFINKNI